MERILRSLAFRIAIDPAFFAPYLIVVGTVAIEVLRRSIPLGKRQSRYLAFILYPLLALSVALLFLALGSPLAHDIARTDIERTFAASFGERVGLIGYSVDERTVQPGSTVLLTLYLHALDDMQTDYSIFVHLLGADGTLIAQDNHYPVENIYPTSRWLQGQVVQDLSQLELPSDITTGEYRIVIGVNQPTGDRLPAYIDGQRVTDDAITLPEVIVVADS